MQYVVLDLSSNLWKVGFSGEAAPRHIVYRHSVHVLGDSSLTYEEEVELMMRDIFTRLLMCTARGRHILVCESLVEPNKSRQALVKVPINNVRQAVWPSESNPWLGARNSNAQTAHKQVLVKRLGAASVCLLPAAQLALYGAGLDGDALVVQVGYGETSVLPVASNVPLVHSAVIAKFGTRDLLLCLQSLALEVTMWLTLFVNGR
jgi:actin-related protein